MINDLGKHEFDERKAEFHKLDKEILRRMDLKKIGGKLIEEYQVLLIQLERIDRYAFFWWGKFNFLPLTIDEYFSMTKRGVDYIKNIYIDFRINRYFTNLEDPEKAVKMVKYETEKKARREIKKTAQNKFYAVTEEYHRHEYNRPHINSFSRMDCNCVDWYLVDFFKDAIILDEKEGLIVDGKKYIEIYKNKTEAEQTHRKKLQDKAVKALNDFFKGNQASEELFNDFFIINDKGEYEIKPNALKKNLYMRLDLATPPHYKKKH